MKDGSGVGDVRKFRSDVLLRSDVLDDMCRRHVAVTLRTTTGRKRSKQSEKERKEGKTKHLDRQTDGQTNSHANKQTETVKRAHISNASRDLQAGKLGGEPRHCYEDAITGTLA